eukprot:COSAG02_NODE_21890_length_771_cov_1.065476_1_plen_56_part_01
MVCGGNVSLLNSPAMESLACAWSVQWTYYHPESQVRAKSWQLLCIDTTSESLVEVD